MNESRIDKQISVEPVPYCTRTVIVSELSLARQPSICIHLARVRAFRRLLLGHRNCDRSILPFTDIGHPEGRLCKEVDIRDPASTQDGGRKPADYESRRHHQ